MDIYIRTNFDTTIGLGHIKRTIRIAEELKIRGHNCVFYIDKLNSKIQIPFENFEIYSNKNMYNGEINDAKLFVKITQKEKPGIVILDDYRFSIVWEQYVSLYHNKIVIFDDLESQKHYADFVINYNPRNYPIVKYNFKRNIKNNCQFLIHPKYNIIEKKDVKVVRNSKIFNITIYIGGGNDQIIVFRLIM